MEISQYQVGQKPARPISINVVDSRGRAADLSFYESHTVRLVNGAGDEVDLGNAELQTAGARTGRFVFVWPTNKSLFDKAGDYELQMVASGAGVLDYTTTHTIRVRAVGRS